MKKRLSVIALLSVLTMFSGWHLQGQEQMFDQAPELDSMCPNGNCGGGSGCNTPQAIPGHADTLAVRRAANVTVGRTRSRHPSV